MMCRAELLENFANRNFVSLLNRTTGGFVAGIISSLEHEDGSGYSFIVTMNSTISFSYRTDKDPIIN